MDRLVFPTKISGTVKPPASKSYMQRAVAAAILSNKKTTLLNPSVSEDCLTVVNIARSYGFQVDLSSEKLIMTPTNNKLGNIIHCGESGLALRMFSSIASLQSHEVSLQARGSLKLRPVSLVKGPLNQLGVKCLINSIFPPVTVKGPLVGGEIEVDGSMSSQFLTGLLMALPTVKKDSKVLVTDLKSTPYIDMTLHVLDKFGISIKNQNYEKFIIKGNQTYKCGEFLIENDWSSASFLLVAAALCGKIDLLGLNLKSLQADKKILDVLKVVGADISYGTDHISIQKNRLDPFDFDATNSPDLFPPLVALALFCNGISNIKGVSRLKTKESDRAKVLKEQLSFYGKSVEIDEDTMRIKGNKDPVTAKFIDSCNDHRIAMSGALCALRSIEGITIKDSDSVKKSYPNFFENLKNLGTKIN